MPKITLDEFCSHWVSRTSTRVMASRLEFNVFDFELLPVTIPGSSSCPHSLRGDSTVANGRLVPPNGERGSPILS
jgi:hypothetical protein